MLVEFLQLGQYLQSVASPARQGVDPAQSRSQKLGFCGDGGNFRAHLLTLCDRLGVCALASIGPTQHAMQPETRRIQFQRFLELRDGIVKSARSQVVVTEDAYDPRRNRVQFLFSTAFCNALCEAALTGHVLAVAVVAIYASWAEL